MCLTDTQHRFKADANVSMIGGSAELPNMLFEVELGDYATMLNKVRSDVSKKLILEF